MCGSANAPCHWEFRITNRFGGDNYKIFFGSDAAATEFIATSDVYTAWKHVHLERDRMCTVGGLLFQDYGAPGECGSVGQAACCGVGGQPPCNQVVLYAPSDVQMNNSLTIFDEVRTFEQGGETRNVSMPPLDNGNGTVTITLGGAALTHSYRAADPVGLPPTTPAFTTGHSGGACVSAGGFWEADPSDLAQPYGDALVSFHIATYGLAGSGSGTIPFVPAAFLDSTVKPCTMRRFSRIWFKNFLQKDAINDCPDPPANTCDRTNQFHVNGARAESSSPALSGISFHNGNFLFVYGEQIAADCTLASGGCTASKAANMVRWVTDHECGHQFRVNDCNTVTNFHDSRPAWCGDLGGTCVNPLHLTEKCVMYRGNTPGQDFDFRSDGIDHFCPEDLLLGDPTCPLSNPQPGAIRTWEDPQ